MGHPQGSSSLGRKRTQRRTQHPCCTAQQCFHARFVQWKKQITICLFRPAGTFSGECAFCAAAYFTVPDGRAPLRNPGAPRSIRSAVLATLPLNVLDGSLYAAVQQEIAVTHFLGVSSLNSGRGQPRPFFIDPFAEQISASGTAATGGDAIERIAVGMRITTAIHRTGRIIR